MRLLVVANGYPPRGRWGTEFYTRELVRGLIGRGHQVAVLHPVRSGERPRFTLEEARGADDVPVFLLYNPGDPKKRFADSYENATVDALFETVLERFQPDLVHFTYLLWGRSVGLPAVARRRGLARLLTVTDYGPLCHRGQFFDWRLEACGGPRPPEVCARCIRRPSRDDAPLGRRLVKRAAADLAALLGGLGRVVTRADLVARERAVGAAFEALQRILTPTEVVRDAYRRAGVPESKLATLVYSLDEGPYAAARAAPVGGPVRFGYLGQFTPHKGVHVLLEAVRLLSGRLPESVEPWEVHLFGKPAGGRHQLYARRLFEPDPGPRVRLHPPFDPDEGPRVLAQLDALVLPSLWDENAPLSCLQARAAGVPVIGSRVAGIAEVIEEGRHGLLFAPGDAEGLADAMRRVILRQVGRLAEPGLPLALEQHLMRLENLYETLVFEARGGAPH
jgi:glycosyltransferase involved in cell wall biosynthesis